MNRGVLSLFSRRRAFMLALSILTSLSLQSIAFGDADVLVKVEPERGTVQDIFTLQVIVKGTHARDVGPPTFEESREFTLEAAGTSTSHSIINGEHSTSITYTFNLVPDPGLKPGVYRIPQGMFRFGGKTVYLKRPTIEISTSPDLPDISKEDGVSFVQVVSDTAPFVGQQILYKAEVAATAQVIDAVLSDARFEGFSNESFGKARETLRNIGGVNTRIYTVREALFPLTPGEITLPPRMLTVKVHERRSSNRRSAPWDLFDDPLFADDFFSFARPRSVVSKRFAAKPITLRVRPLPPAPIEGLKYIPVGSFELSVDVDNQEVQEGDSVNLTLTLSGNGNLRPYELQEPEFPRERFRAYADKPKVEATVHGGEIRHTKTFSIAFVPLVSGELTLPSYTVTWFDPNEERYHIERTKAFSLKVRANPSSQTLDMASLRGTNTTQTPQQGQTVSILGHDLLPQHTGPATYLPAPEMSRSMWIIVILLPVGAILIRLSLERIAPLFKDPTRIRQLAAYRRFTAALGQLEKDAQAHELGAAADALRTYIGERLGCNPAALTAEEAAALVRRALPNSYIAEEVHTFLSTAERARYGGSEFGEQTPHAATTARALAEAIERGVPKS